MATLYTHAQLVDWLERAAKDDRSVRKEMSKLFQVANRRIQNLENSMKAGRIGYSPAYDAVIKYTGDAQGRFSKFHMVEDWDTMLEQAAQATAFVNQPTSTATGARKWQRELSRGITHRNGTPIDEQEMSKFMRAVYANDDDSSSQFREIAARYVQSSTEMAIGDVTGDMDSFIREYVKNTNENIRRQAEEMADYVDSFAVQMFETLNKDPFHEIS